jgi:hypothetical protein
MESERAPEGDEDKRCEGREQQREEPHGIVSDLGSAAQVPEAAEGNDGQFP